MWISSSGACFLHQNTDKVLTEKTDGRCPCVPQYQCAVKPQVGRNPYPKRLLAFKKQWQLKILDVAG